MTSFPLQLTTAQKDALDDIGAEIKKFEWETGEYSFHDFVEYFQLPQIIRISQPWDTNFAKGDILYLQSIHSRHLITSKSLTTDNRTFIIPDWFQGQFRILTQNPVYKPRWWKFQNVLELLRFEMPRPHIRLCTDAKVLLLLPTNQKIPVMLKENTEVTLSRIEKSTTITDGKEMFVLVDRNDQEFLLDPTETPSTFRFACRILDKEFDESYHKNTREGLFTLPEIIIRYELPIDIESVSLSTIPSVENFPQKLRLEKYAIAKSIVAFSITDTNRPRILEFSSLTQFSLNCIKCLTTGLPRDSSVYEEGRTFDEQAYRHYEIVRERLGQLLDDVSVQYLRTPFLGNPEEINSIEKVHDIGTKIKNDEKNQMYVLLDQVNNNTANESNEAILSITNHPTRFTVHLPVDFSSPYSAITENVDPDEDDHEMPPATTH